MSIWIRSQDKMTLKEVSCFGIEKVYFDENTGSIHNYDYVNTYVEVDDERKQSLKLVYRINDLGMYSTLEKALKVSNAIQLYIATKTAFKSMDSKSLDNCVVTLKKLDMSEDEVMQQMFGAYEMPQDEEINL